MAADARPGCFRVIHIDCSEHTGAGVATVACVRGIVMSAGFGSGIEGVAREVTCRTGRHRC